MKTKAVILIILIGSIVVAGNFKDSATLSESKKHYKAKKSSEQMITIKSDGKVKKIPYHVDKGSDELQILSSTTGRKDGVILSYGRGVDVDIEGLESRYNIEYVEKLGISHHSFKNTSQYSDAELIKVLIEGEKELKSARANLKVRAVLY